jgi:hypothetical protein
MIANENGLKILQKNIPFGEQPKQKQQQAVSTPRQGFTIDPMTGEKKYVTNTGSASPRLGSPRTTTTTSTTNSPRTQSTSNKQYTIDDLEKLSDMKNKGLLSEQEFSKIKSDILGL